jgi:hypothetical protein
MKLYKNTLDRIEKARTALEETEVNICSNTWVHIVLMDIEELYKQDLEEILKEADGKQFESHIFALGEKTPAKAILIRDLKAIIERRLGE